MTISDHDTALRLALLKVLTDSAAEQIAELIAERDEARAEAARLRAAVEGAGEEISEGDWVCIILGHARVEMVGDRTEDGIPIIGFGHEGIGLAEPIPLVLTEDVKVIRAAQLAAPVAKGADQ